MSSELGLARLSNNSYPDSQSGCQPLSEFTHPPFPAVPFIPDACGTLGIEALSQHGLLESLPRVPQQPGHTLVDLWFSMRLHRKLWRTTVRDGCGPNEDSTDDHRRISTAQSTVTKEGGKTHAVSPYMGLMPPASRPVRKRCMRTARPAESPALVGWW